LFQAAATAGELTATAAELISRAGEATTALPSAPDRVAAEGNSTDEDDPAGWLVAEGGVAGGAEFLFALGAVTAALRRRSTDRRELAALFVALVGTEAPRREVANRLRVLVAGDAEVDGGLTAADALESDELEPGVVEPSSAAAIPGVAPNATPTPAVTAPIWSHRSTGNVAESRVERRIPLWLGMIELLGKDIG
jgi:hypothetical protein